jgi:hypothetical protein
VTFKSLVALPVWSPRSQVTVTGHEPAVVLTPTFQLQLTSPAAFAVLGSRPAAVDGPDLYSTSIVQYAAAAVLTAAVAVFPPAIGVVSFVNVTAIVAASDGSGVGVGSGVEVGATLGTSDGAVEGAVDALVEGPG